MRKAIAIVAAALMLCVSCATADVSESTVSVSGSGAVVLKADMVRFNISVSEQAKTTGEAQQAANEKVAKVLEILRANGIKDEDMSTSSLSFSSEYNWESSYREKVCETVSQSIYVKMKNIDGFGALVDALGSGVSGISFSGVNFDASDRTEANSKARELAYQDAYEKACAYAQQAGLKVDRVLSINDGYTSYSTGNTSYSYAKMEMAAAPAAAPDMAYGTEAPVGQLTVTSEVSVIFIIK